MIVLYSNCKVVLKESYPKPHIHAGTSSVVINVVLRVACIHWLSDVD